MDNIRIFNRNELDGIAESVFFAFPGIRAASGGAHGDEELLAVRDRHFADLEGKAAMAFIHPSYFQNQRFDFEGRIVAGDCFAAVRPNSVEGVCFYMLTLGGGVERETETAAGTGYEALIFDLWGNAYLKALRELTTREILARYSREEGPELTAPIVSHVFLPGIGGIGMEANAIIADIVGADRLGMKILDSGAMRPEKSISAICFIAESRTAGTSGGTADSPCESCAGGSAGCEFCTAPQPLGLAFDVGTTNLRGALVALNTGESLKIAASPNPQSKYGKDVISRIAVASKRRENLQKLRAEILNAINGVAFDLLNAAGRDARDLTEVCIVANPTMGHLFVGEDPSSLGEAPHTPVFTESRSGSLGSLAAACTDRASIYEAAAGAVYYLAPSIGGHVGSDILAGMLAANMTAAGGENQLLIDMGTNGEIVLRAGSRYIACSTAAGPAFERAGSRGSDTVTALASLLGYGAIDRAGKVVSEKIVAAAGLSQEHIRQIQLAKAAIRAGIETLLEKCSVAPCDLDAVFVTGNFGGGIDADAAKAIGLLPPVESRIVSFVPEAALKGAIRMMLSDRAKEAAERFAPSVEHPELANESRFRAEYIKQMDF